MITTGIKISKLFCLFSPEIQPIFELNVNHVTSISDYYSGVNLAQNKLHIDLDLKERNSN